MFLGSLSRQGHFGGAVQAPIKGRMVIASGDAGIYQTVAVIRQKAREGMAQPAAIQTVRSILAGLPPTASQAEKSQALVRWWVANIRYRHDDDMSWTEHGLQWIHIADCPARYRICEPVEIVADVPQILSQRYGDCDDFVVGLGAFHSLAGMRWCPVIVALDASDPREFSHIYLLAQLDGVWRPIDAVNASQPWGWEAPQPFRKQVLC